MRVVREGPVNITKAATEAAFFGKYPSRMANSICVWSAHQISRLACARALASARRSLVFRRCSLHLPDPVIAGR